MLGQQERAKAGAKSRRGIGISLRSYTGNNQALLISDRGGQNDKEWPSQPASNGCLLSKASQPNPSITCRLQPKTTDLQPSGRLTEFKWLKVSART